MITLRPSPFLRPFVKDAPFLSGWTLSGGLQGARVVRSELDRFVDRLALQDLNQGPFHQALTHFGYGVASNGHGLSGNQARRLGETFDGLSRVEQLGVISAAFAVVAETIEEGDDDRLQNQVLGIWRGTITGLNLRFEGLGEMPPDQIGKELDSLRAKEAPYNEVSLSWWKWPLAFPAQEWGQRHFKKAFPASRKKRAETPDDASKVYHLLKAADFLGWGGAYYLAGEAALSAAVHALRLGLPKEIVYEAWRKSGMYFINSGHLAHTGYVYFSAGWYGLSLIPLMDAKGPKEEKLVSREISSSIARLALQKEEDYEDTSKAFVLSLLQQMYGEYWWERDQERLAFTHFVDGASNAAKAGIEETAFRILANNVWSIVGIER